MEAERLDRCGLVGLYRVQSSEKGNTQMSIDEQIEEMANAILYQGDNYDTCCKDDCETIALLIYNKGYRKASDLAEEIFAEIEEIAIEHEMFGRTVLIIGQATLA